MDRSRVWIALSRVTVCTCLALLAGTAHAQPCADPDGDGDVTEADGIITLGAAAGLESDCSLTICDVDTNGVIDDTDGVLVFRKAAELEVEENCLETTGGPVDPRAALLVEFVLPFLQVPFQYVPQIGGLPTPSEDEETIIDCDNFGDGDILIEADEFDTVVTFTECLFGNTIFEGEIADGEDGFLVDMTVLDPFTESDIAYESENLLVSDLGTGLRISGVLLASPFFDLSILEDADVFELSLFALEITPDGGLRAGRATLDLAEAGLPDLRRIVLEFDGTNIAVVTVTNDALAESVYLYDIAANRFL